MRVSLLPAEKDVLPLVLKVKSRKTSREEKTAARDEIIGLLHPYLCHVSKWMKFRFNGSCPAISDGDLVQIAEEILFRRVIPNYRRKEGRFLSYATHSLYMDMFKAINEESTSAKMVVSLNSVKFDDSDEPINDEEWTSRHSKKKGPVPPHLQDKGSSMVEVEHLLKSIEKANPMGAELLRYAVVSGIYSIRKIAVDMNIPKSTAHRKIADAVAVIKKLCE